jgi:hypothetical protein
MRRIRESMKNHTDRWIFGTVCVIFLCILGFLYISQGMGDFIYSEHLEDVAFKVDDMEITLKEASYYVMVIESNINDTALKYNANDPKRYWNIYMNDGENKSNFLGDQAKEAMELSCVRDAVYFQEAEKAGIELTSEEKSEIMSDAKDQEKLMTGKMLEVTGYDYADMYAALEKIAVVKKYINTLMEDGYTEEQLDVDGEYYEKIKGEYDIWVNEDMWDEVQLGSVTIN